MIKHIFARLAWATVLFVVLAQVVQIPAVEAALKTLQGTSSGRALIVAVLCAWGATALGLWLTSIIYAHRRAKQSGGRYYTVALLVFTNFIGALVYYFAFVRRHAEPDLRTSASAR